MTIQQAITKSNEMRPGNAVSSDTKLDLLCKLDLLIYKTFLSDFEDTEDFDGHTAVTDTLLAEEPFDEMYSFYLAARIDLAQQDYPRYNDTTIIFEEMLNRWKNYYQTKHLRKKLPNIKVGDLN